MGWRVCIPLFQTTVVETTTVKFNKGILMTTTDATTLQTLKAGDLKELASMTGDPCVSILMRTHRSGREVQQGPIRLKNLLKEASQKLKAADYDDGILDVLTSRLSEHEFWHHQGAGLAIYLTPEDCRIYRLNRPVDEKVCVGESFFVQPLIRGTNSGGEYFVLALSWDEATLFRAAEDSFTMVETRLLPAKFDDLIAPRDPEESLQNTSHRSMGKTSGPGTAMFHGQGEGEDKIAADRDHFLSQVGDEVAGAIYNTGLPLLVAATSEVTGHFEATTKVRVDAKVDGSPSEWSADELRTHAHQAILSELKPDHAEFAERFGTAMARSKASDDLEEILKAAKAGRVASLLVCQRDDSCEQTNHAVLETLRNGGDVLQCKPESMPGGAGAAVAIYRF